MQLSGNWSVVNLCTSNGRQLYVKSYWIKVKPSNYLYAVKWNAVKSNRDDFFQINGDKQDTAYIILWQSFWYSRWQIHYLSFFEREILFYCFIFCKIQDRIPNHFLNFITNNRETDFISDQCLVFLFLTNYDCVIVCHMSFIIEYTWFCKFVLLFLELTVITVTVLNFKIMKCFKNKAICIHLVIWRHGVKAGNERALRVIIR